MCPAVCVCIQSAITTSVDTVPLLCEQGVYTMHFCALLRRRDGGGAKRSPSTIGRAELLGSAVVQGALQPSALNKPPTHPGAWLNHVAFSDLPESSE